MIKIQRSDDHTTTEQEVLLAETVCNLIQSHQTHYNSYDILNIYMFGSRLYGTATPESDYDIMAIVSDESFNVMVTRVTDEHVTVSENAHLRKTSFVQCETPDDSHRKFDITIYSKSYFLQKLHSYNAHELAILWAPNSCKIQERFNLMNNWPDMNEEGDPVLVLAKLRKTLSSQTNGVWKVSKQWFSDALKKNIHNEQHKRIDLIKAKKGFIHCLRIYQFGIQMAKNGQIVDYTSANEFMAHPWVSDPEMQDFEKFHAHFRPIFVNLHHQFNQVAPKANE